MAAPATSQQVTLFYPLKRGDKEITQVTVHKPHSGQLRGVSLYDASQMHNDAIVTVIPRISDPQITAQEMAIIDPCDLMQFGAVLANFLLPPSLIAEAEANLNSRTE